MWNQRYDRPDFFYGTEPNDFLVSQIHRFKAASKILCLAEGEGRNAIYLASLGHQVSTLDSSSVGLAKGEALAKTRQLSLNWICADLAEYDLGLEQWDAIVCIFGHLPPALRAKVLGQIPAALNQQGLFIAEYYHPDQVKYGTGGPPDPTWMPMCDQIQQELGSPCLILHQAEIERVVIEGIGHTGLAKVSQWVSQKL